MLVRSGEEKGDGDGDFAASNKTDQDSGSRSSSNRQQEHISKNLGHSKNLLNVSQVVRDLSAHMHSLTLDPIHSRGTTIFNKTTFNQSTELTFLSQYLII